MMLLSNNLLLPFHNCSYCCSSSNSSNSSISWGGTGKAKCHTSFLREWQCTARVVFFLQFFFFLFFRIRDYAILIVVCQLNTNLKLVSPRDVQLSRTSIDNVHFEISPAYILLFHYSLYICRPV